MGNTRMFKGFRKNVRKKSTMRFGFTLTEIAVVLAIVGGIVAGIFVAYSAAEYRILLNQGVDEINLIVGNMRSLAASRVASVGVLAYGAAGEAQLVGQGVFPSEMIRPTAPTLADNPWNQSVANGSAEIEVNTPTAGQFTLEYLNIPPEVCADLLVRNSLPGTDTGLVQINVADTTATINNTYVYSPAAAAYQLPLSSITAAASCPPQIIVGGVVVVPAPLYNIQWTYTLGS